MADFSRAGEVATGAWAAFELGLRVREEVRAHNRAVQDRGTRVVIVLAIGASIVVASVTASSAPAVRIAGPAPGIAGAVLMWLGLALRAWAVQALGGAFRTTVEVEPGQRVITRGPYRRLRHPSYTGLLLIMAGLGLEFGTWPGVAACVVLPLAALVHRVRVEEAELERVLGDRYRAYAATTKRLVPGVW